jgi:hypothetical protein
MSEQLPAVIDRSRIIGDARAPIVPAMIAVAGERASLRFLAQTQHSCHQMQSSGHGV